MHCNICNEEKEIQTAGSYATILVCGHVNTSVSTANIIKSGANSVQAESIKESLTKTQELPSIDTQEVVTRALSGMKSDYDTFFTSENQLIKDMIEEHGTDKAVLMFTAIHSHMSHVLFTMSRFRNLYFTQIEQMRKEIEDKSVKELIQSHDFYYKDVTPKPKAPKKLKIGTDVDKAKEHMKGLTDKDGNPIDVTKVLANLMWGGSKKAEKDKEKEEYKKGLDSIADSITSKKEAS